MNTNTAPLPQAGGGAVVSGYTIIAALCSDMGCEISCVQCGHVFAASKPLTDESVEVSGTWLAKQLADHMCSYRPPEKIARVRGVPNANR